MFAILLPILSVILVGFLYGKRKKPSPDAEAHINRYVLYIALPSMIFLAVAKASLEQLRQGAFIGAGLIGIAVAYGLGLLLARRSGIRAPHSSIIGMTASFGNTGYMGIPLVLAAFGDAGAAPAAIATILHNIPTFFAVIMTFGAYSPGQEGSASSLASSLLRAFRAVLSNPLILAAFAGAVFVVFVLPLPVFLETFTRFMGAAAAPTGLFTLGLSLARMDARRHLSRDSLRLVFPIMMVKNLIQPLATFLAAMLFGMRTGDPWLATAVIMAATPTGAMTYLFAFAYRSDPAPPSLAIIFSSALSVLTLPLIMWALH